MNTTANTTLWALTHVNRHGLRQLTRPNQGRNHWTTRELAECYLRGFLHYNGEARLAEIFGPQSIGTFKVWQIKCHASGDAVRVYFS